ncbi:MAG: LytTR family DNA-binding domain-containing protein [Propionibacteriaceae bacterium]|jgi:DNA-binding LytR/AlgR family response regulator|nr:LytTR family DNA-binding domain-containing protein [Propionibacteriaceae bacterium]
MAYVLVAEDDRAIAALLSQYIVEESPQSKVAQFASAADAYRCAEQVKVDLFILDIQLEDYAGTSLARQLRALPQYRFTPIIFVTGMASEELSAYRDVQAHRFLTKPFTKDQFVAAFRAGIDLSGWLSEPAPRLRITQKSFIFEYELSTIVFVESFGKRLVIHVNRSGLKQDTITGLTLGRLLAMLPTADFIQCHKSYLVQRRYIRRIDKGEMRIILAPDDRAIPIGEAYRANLWSGGDDVNRH